jgi:hypothetical protein
MRHEPRDGAVDLHRVDVPVAERLHGFGESLTRRPDEERVRIGLSVLGRRLSSCTGFALPDVIASTMRPL